MCVKFKDVLMEPYWDPNICGIEPYRALKLKIPNEKLVKGQNLKGY